ACPTCVSTTATVGGSGTITANFMAVPFAVTFAVSPSGAGTTNPSGTVEIYSSASISATPTSGYIFSSWSSNTPAIYITCTGCASTTISVAGAGTITANFVIAPYSVTFAVSPSGGGSTSPSGTVGYDL